MAKSSYPNKIDSSAELPIVRNNITEINAELLNSLRDAIIQIEKTLGVNPNGITTVSNRLSESLDLDGSIKKEAFDKAGVIYGPITNEIVSKVAAIEESKLRLDFPTRLLQTEISLLKSELELFTNIIDELSAKLSSHINSLSRNRHNSDNISVPEINIEASSTSTSGFIGGTLSEALLDIYNNHIGFSEDASQVNNAHNASQIYFNNSSTADLIQIPNVQSAIEELASQKNNSLKTNLFYTNSNGIIRYHKALDVSNNVDGKLKLSYTNASYSSSSGQRQLVTLEAPATTIYDIEKFDILEISSDIEEDNRKYLILDFELSGSSLVNVTILGGAKNNSDVNSQIRIFKNPYQYSNLNAYNTTVRPRYNRTNTPDIIIAHPNAATIVTKNIVTEKISSTTSNIGIEIDGEIYTIPVYNSSRGTQNTLDEIILNINEYLSDNKIPAFAYKYRDISCFEIAISHVLPSWIDSDKNRYLKIVTPASNDATSEFGLEHMLDIEVYGTYGNSVLINGNTVQDNDNILTYLGSDLELIVGTNNFEFNIIDPIEQGIKVGNLCYIEDNGLYRIQSIVGNTIALDNHGDTFSEDIALNKKIFIYKSTVSLEDLEFSEIVGSEGSLILDIFMTEDLDYGYNIRASVEGNLINSSFLGIITDISKDYLLNQVSTVSISTSGLATVFDGTSISAGDQLYSSGEYIIRSPSGSGFLKLATLNGPPLLSPISVTINGFDEIPFGAIHLSRCVYSTSFGFIIGESNIGVPTMVDKRPSGTINETNISPSLIEKYVTGPRGELITDGVVFGMDFSETTVSSTDCLISINPGFYYNSGIRYKFNGVIDIPFSHGGTNFFVGLDKNGCLRIGAEITDPVSGDQISPFYSERIAYIAYYLVASGGVLIKNDIRKNISFIDKKIDQIIVAEEQDAGHFTSIKDAVNYARYYRMFNKSPICPSILIKNGTYEIDETIVLDFDISIVGSGPRTVLRSSDSFLSFGNNEDITLSDYSSSMFLIGSDDDSLSNQSSNFVYGIKVSNLTCKYAESYSSALNSNFNSYFMISQGIDTNDLLSFKFDNIFFEGSSSMDESSSNSTPLDGNRQIIPVAIVLASDTITGNIPQKFGGIIISNCIFNYVGTGWSTVGAIISKVGSYEISNCNIYGNIIKNASPKSSNVYNDNYSIFDASINYTISGFTPPTLSSTTISLTNISVAANTLSD